jgi:hypothetical protein
MEYSPLCINFNEGTAKHNQTRETEQTEMVNFQGK